MCLLISDLFAQFDPRVSFIFKYSSLVFWACNFLILFFVTFSRVYANWSPITRFFRSRVKLGFSICAEFGVGIYQGIINILVVVFFFILLINFFGLLPATFRVSRHFIFTITLAVPLWAALLIMTFRKLPVMKLGRYIGTGIPSVLGPPIGACEVLRAVIRPLALGLRLGANILAGHVILSLATNRMRYGILYGGVGVLAFTFVSFGLFLFEAAVCIIQAYVFMLLLRIYVSEYSVF